MNPDGVLTTIVPVATEQLGCCVTLTVGAAGVAGCALITTGVALLDTHEPLVT